MRLEVDGRQFFYSPAKEGDVIMNIDHIVNAVMLEGADMVLHMSNGGEFTLRGEIAAAMLLTLAKRAIFPTGNRVKTIIDHAQSVIEKAPQG
jgi:hypothetical protein